jgi:hypothetical protein
VGFEGMRKICEMMKPWKTLVFHVEQRQLFAGNFAHVPRGTAKAFGQKAESPAGSQEWGAGNAKSNRGKGLPDSEKMLP